MDTSIPIVFTEAFKLTSLGVKPETISFSNVSMESDKYICVREKPTNGPGTITIIEVERQQVSTHKINAEAAIMNPKTKVVALRAGNDLQVFSLEMGSRMKQTTFNEPILFWKWINAKTIVLVTKSSVYHWSMEGRDEPQKMFDRHPNFEGAAIINYRTDNDLNWLLLIGLLRTTTGTTKGVMQLYSVEKGVTQAIEGHAATFIDFRLPGNKIATLVCIASNTPAGGKLFIMEVPSSRQVGFPKKALSTNFVPGDFPVAMQASERLGVLYIITLKGLIYVYDIETGTLIFQNRISSETIFTTAVHEKTDGIIGINNKLGQVLSISIDKQKIVGYLNSTGNSELAIKIAARANLPGADELYVSQFNQFLNENRIEDAVKLAVNSPGGILRNPQTIQRLQRLPRTQPNQKPALSMYFQYIIETDKLNEYESLELARIVLQRTGGIEYIKKLISEGKMEAGERLGDLIKPLDTELAMQIYLKGGSHEKIIDNLLAVGEFKRVLAYCQKVNYEPNYLDLFKKLVQVNRDAAVQFAIQLHEKNVLDPKVVVDILVQVSAIKQATAYLLGILVGDRPEDAELQTRLLEINLLYSPIEVPDKILAQEMFTHYDKEKIAQLCEKVGLFQRALENYSSLEDRKRVIVNTQYMNADWLEGFFGKDLSDEEAIECLKVLMRHNLRQNLNIVVRVATKYAEALGIHRLIQLFEEFKSWEGLFYFLGALVDFSEDPDVHFKYIQAATMIGQLQEVERITRDSNFYDPVKTKEFLKEARLKDMMPLINVCDKHNFIEELVTYLYSNQLLKYVDIYVKQRNPLKTPQVVGALLDVDASEDYIKQLIMAVGAHCPVEPLVNEVEKRNRLKILLQWLEARISEGSQEPAAHNAIAKIYIDQNNNAEKFLETNQYYDSKVVGKYCEKRDPNLAFIAYKRGQCDVELVEVTNKNGMFKQQARYLVKRQSPELWAYVLNDGNTYRKQLINQVVQTALPETQNAEEVSTTVKAFMSADLPNELIELLEKIVLHGNSEFKQNRNLQNLLILTAIKADKSRVMDYINRLDNYDAPDIAAIADTSGLFEEAFEIYKKFKMNTKAVEILLDKIESIPRAVEFAARVNDPEVWSLVGRAQLGAEMVPEAIESFLKAQDPSAYHDVINAAERSENFKELIGFLLMARKKIHDSIIDTELVYSYARYAKQNPASSSLADMEEFISGPNTAQIQQVGDRCFEEEMYEAAKILYQSISNWGSLASALIKLGKNREAVNAATKANTPRTWREVMCACVDAQEFKYALTCGLNLITDSEQLDFLVQYYQDKGYFDELIDLLEKGLGLERANMPMFTALGVLYAKFKPNKLMEHIQRYHKRCNIPKLLIACEQNHLWAEMVFLYKNHDEYENAVKTMMTYPVESFDHSVFSETIVKVANPELLYEAIQFYLTYSPEDILDLLTVMISRLDHERVAREVKQAGGLPLIKKYLETVQEADLTVVNETLNDLYIEEEDYEALRKSIDEYTNFDGLALAQKIENHELLEFRRIAAHLYKLNKRYKESIELSKKDKLYKDAMETACESRDLELNEELLRFFVENDLKDCFAACLYVCYDYIRPDIAFELAWRAKITDMAMPYMIQVIREYTSKVDELQQFMEETKKKEEEAKKQPVEVSEEIQPPYYDQTMMPPEYVQPYPPEYQQPYPMEYQQEYDQHPPQDFGDGFF